MSNYRTVFCQTMNTLYLQQRTDEGWTRIQTLMMGERRNTFSKVYTQQSFILCAHCRVLGEWTE